MEITFQNKRGDFEAFYNYMVKETQQGKVINKQALFTQHFSSAILALLLGSIFGLVAGGWQVALSWALILFVFSEGVFLLKAGLKPRYYYGIQVYKQQEKSLKPKDLQVFSLPKKLIVDDDWLEIRSSEASHRYRWRMIDLIGITPDHIFIHVGTCPVVYIPKRDFPSEQKFLDFGKKLMELQEKNKNQPIGVE